MTIWTPREYRRSLCICVYLPPRSITWSHKHAWRELSAGNFGLKLFLLLILVHPDFYTQYRKQAIGRWSSSEGLPGPGLLFIMYLPCPLAAPSRIPLPPRPADRDLILGFLSFYIHESDEIPRPEDSVTFFPDGQVTRLGTPAFPSLLLGHRVTIFLLEIDENEPKTKKTEMDATNFPSLHSQRRQVKCKSRRRRRKCKGTREIGTSQDMKAEIGASKARCGWRLRQPRTPVGRPLA